MKNEGQLYGLIGHPLSHSFSAAYFKNKFEKAKLPHAYLNFDQDPIPDLSLLIEKHPNLRGLNVTIPYKEAILNQLHEIEPEAGIIGAVNVISIKDGRTKGYNTDTEAFFKSLKPTS